MGTSEYTIHVPMRLNSGARVSAEFFRTLESRLASIGGGFTRTRTVGGYTTSDGTLKRESVYVYTLFAPSNPSTGERVHSLACHVKIQLAQESVLVTARRIAAEFV